MSSATMNEKRKYARFTVEGMDIYARTILNTEAQILDISGSGLSLRCCKRLNIGGLYTFKFEADKKALAIRGVVVWEKMSGSRELARGEITPVYTAGVEFKEVMTEKAQEIMNFITEKILELKERRLRSVRIRINGGKKVMLTRLEDCEVKDLSLGGMRVELKEEIPVETLFDLELVVRENELFIPCKARVVFCREIAETAPILYTAGIEFREISEDGAMRLGMFLETFPMSTAKPHATRRQPRGPAASAGRKHS